MNNQNRPFRLASLGLQHVLAMYAGAILVPLMVGRALNLNAHDLSYLVAIDLLTCGLATLLQAWTNRWFGIGLPVVLGSSFVAVTPMIAIGTQYGISAVYGAIIAGGIFIVLAASFLGKIIKFFPSRCHRNGCDDDWFIACTIRCPKIWQEEWEAKILVLFLIFFFSFGVLALILILNRFFSGFLRSLSVLIGIVAGTIAAVLMGKVDFTNFNEASWLHVPHSFLFWDAYF